MLEVIEVARKNRIEQVRITVRQATMEDLESLLEIDAVVWSGFPASEEMIRSRLKVFPQGQFVALCDDRVIGSVYSQLVDYKSLPESFTWAEATDNGTIQRTHKPKGRSVYGVGLAVLPEFQGTSASQLLIVSLAKFAVFSCRYRVLWGARIPSYHKHAQMSVEEYIKKRTKSGRPVDPELALYWPYGAEPIRPLPNYMPDSDSLNCGVLVVATWKSWIVRGIERILTKSRLKLRRCRRACYVG